MPFLTADTHSIPAIVVYAGEKPARMVAPFKALAMPWLT